VFQKQNIVSLFLKQANSQFRHCEELLRRSNPEKPIDFTGSPSAKGGQAASLAMTPP